MAKRSDTRTVEYGVRISDKLLSVIKLKGYDGDLDEIQSWLPEAIGLSEKDIKDRLVSQGLRVETVMKYEFKHPAP